MRKPFTLDLTSFVLLLTILLLCFALTVFNLYAPKTEWERIIVKAGDCEGAKTIAEDYFKKGNYLIFIAGLFFQAKKDTRNKYGIKKQHVGSCIMPENLDCYNQKMIQLLGNKFGVENLNKTFHYE